MPTAEQPLCGCGKRPIQEGHDECFGCRVKTVGFGFRGSASHGRAGWNKTANDWRRENFGTSDERELAKRGIERASNFS